MPPQIVPRTTDALPSTPTSDGSPGDLPTPKAVGSEELASGRLVASTLFSLLSELDEKYTSIKPPASLLRSYTSALNAIPDGFGSDDYYTDLPLSITRTPFASTISELSYLETVGVSTQFVPNQNCAPDQSTTNRTLAVATVPKMNTATST